MDSTTAAASALWKYITATPVGVVSAPLAQPRNDWQPTHVRGAAMDKLWSVVLPGQLSQDTRMANIETRLKPDAQLR